MWTKLKTNFVNVSAKSYAFPNISNKKKYRYFCINIFSWQGAIQLNPSLFFRVNIFSFHPFFSDMSFNPVKKCTFILLFVKFLYDVFSGYRRSFRSENPSSRSFDFNKIHRCNITSEITCYRSDVNYFRCLMLRADSKSRVR